MWHVPSHWEWGMHKKAHDAAASVKISVGARPRMSRDFWLAEVDILSLHDWHSRFSELAYRGQNFLDLEGSKRNSSLLPSTLKGSLDASYGDGNVLVCTPLQVRYKSRPIGGISDAVQYRGPCGLRLPSQRPDSNLGPCSLHMP
jgi:hypothetical protein